MRVKESDLWKSNLNNLLTPSSIAVVGASENPGPGRNTIFNLVDSGFKGDIFPINPKYEKLFNLACYPNLKALSKVPDAVAISVPIQLVKNVLLECAEIGVKNVTIFTSGFAEFSDEGKQVQDELEKIAAEHQINLCGPNCLGHFNFNEYTGLYSGSLPNEINAGGVSIVSQSGSMAIAMMYACKDIGIHHIISYGNQAVLDISDYLTYLSEDEATKVIVTYIEGINEGEKFLKAVKKCEENGKPVIVLKIGKSDMGKQVALSHTASLVGSQNVFNAACEENGIIQIDDIDEMRQTVIAMLQAKKVKGTGVLGISISGGQCGLMGDMASAYQLNFPPLNDRTKEKLKEVLPPYINPTNPFDVGGVTDFVRMMEICASDESIDLVIISQDAPEGLGLSGVDSYSQVTQAIIDVYDKVNIPIIVFSNHSTPYDKRVFQNLIDKNIPYLQGTREAMVATKNLIQYYDYLRQQDSYRLNEIKNVTFTNEQTLNNEGKLFLTENEVKNVLKEFGIQSTVEVLCTSEEQLKKEAINLGYPVVLKIDSPDIAHKTEVNGVVLDIRSEQELMEAYTYILKNVRERMPEAKINGVLLQEMVEDGVDLVLGINEDAQFGHAMLYGLGGIYVEILKDVSVGLLPITEQKAKSMIEQSISKELLGEFRGKAKLDEQQLIDLMIKLSYFTMTYKDEIVSIDLNPVRINEDGIKVLDGIIELKQT